MGLPGRGEGAGRGGRGAGSGRVGRGMTWASGSATGAARANVLFTTISILKQYE